MRFLIIYITFLIGLYECLLRVGKEWPDGFQGTLLIPVEGDHKLWELEIGFNATVNIQTSSGNLTKNVNNQTFVYCRYMWDDSPKINTTYYFEFVANGGVKPINLITASFDGQPVNLSLIIVSPSSIFPSKSVNISTYKGTYDYGAVLYASLLFYESQRSGRLPSNKRISWRGDSMLNDRGKNGEDLTGGYFAQDSNFYKISSQMAVFTSTLAWGVIDYEDAYVKAGQLEYVRDAIRWSTDYLMKAHVEDYELYEYVGDVYSYGSTSDRWSRPEDSSQPRPTLKLNIKNCSVFVPGEVAATLAAASIVFRLSDHVYESKLIRHAKQLYIYATSCASGHLIFTSSDGGYALTWASMWLFYATREQNYLLNAKKYYTEHITEESPSNIYQQYIRRVEIQVLMAKITTEEKYRESVQRSCDHILRVSSKTSTGLAYFNGNNALKSTVDMAFVVLQAGAIGVNRDNYFNFTNRQIGYILGDSGRSFVVGVGQNYPRRPTDQASSCPALPATCNQLAYYNPNPNPYLLVGALVSGSSFDDWDYKDDRTETSGKNIVSVENNAGFQSAVAGLLHYQIKVEK
ncbi:hypothetical protein I4U23_031327 [Adineta vaga]|nr:hypothetical protein I4U23_031327 [Adineta vaga]